MAPKMHPKSSWQGEGPTCQNRAVAAAGAVFSWFFGYMFHENSVKNNRKIGSKTEHAPKTRQDASKMRRRRPQDAPKTPQDALKTRPRRPKTPPRSSKTPPRCPQDAPRCAKTLPRHVLGAQTAPKWSQVDTRIHPKSSFMLKTTETQKTLKKPRKINDFCSSQGSNRNPNPWKIDLKIISWKVWRAKMLPRRPKTTPRHPETLPRRLQDAPRLPKTAPRRPKMPQDAA